MMDLRRVQRKFRGFDASGMGRAVDMVDGRDCVVGPQKAAGLLAMTRLGRTGADVGICPCFVGACGAVGLLAVTWPGRAGKAISSGVVKEIRGMIRVRIQVAGRQGPSGSCMPQH